ncbi:MAG: pyridoxal phosphate-dependent aminotransferase [Haloferacaceae archaeon]
MPTTYPPRIEPSATIRMGDRARELAAAGADVINLGSGSPDFTSPDHVNEAATAALEAGHTQMAATAGVPELREAIAEKLARDNGIEADPADVGVTPGSKFALYAAVLSLVREGDEVVLLDPCWVSYEAMVDLAGGDLTRVRLDADTGFSLSDVDLAAAVSDDTRALVLNNPSNPTGRVFSRAELERVRDLAVEHDFWVVADEIYERMTYGAEHTSVAALDGMADRTVTANGFSKAYAMSGWRLGYFTGPSDVVDAVQTIQSQTVSSATTFAQHAAVAALRGPQAPVEAMRRTYDERIGAAMDVLRDAGVDVPRPEGAFYLFVPVAGDDDVAVAESILDEHRVATTPGSAFGVPGYVRIACTVPEDRLTEGVGRITDHLASP